MRKRIVEVSVLLSGAADYITKSFEMKELLARITVRLRFVWYFMAQCFWGGHFCELQYLVIIRRRRGFCKEELQLINTEVWRWCFRGFCAVYLSF